jgi:hypothetical protein
MEIEIKTGKARMLLVEVPEGADRFTIHGLFKHNNFMYYKKDGECVNRKFGFEVDFLATTKTLSENQAKEVIPIHSPTIFMSAYEDYSDYWPWFYTALESFTSLLQSHGIDRNKNYAILIVK